MLTQPSSQPSLIIVLPVTEIIGGDRKGVELNQTRIEAAYSNAVMVPPILHCVYSHVKYEEYLRLVSDMRNFPLQKCIPSHPLHRQHP